MRGIDLAEGDRGVTRRAPICANEISPAAPSLTLHWPCRPEEQLHPLADRAGQEGVRCEIHRGGSRRWNVPVVDQGKTWEEV